MGGSGSKDKRTTPLRRPPTSPAPPPRLPSSPSSPSTPASPSPPPAVMTKPVPRRRSPSTVTAAAAVDGDIHVIDGDVHVIDGGVESVALSVGGDGGVESVALSVGGAGVNIIK